MPLVRRCDRGADAAWLDDRHVQHQASPPPREHPRKSPRLDGRGLRAVLFLPALDHAVPDPYGKPSGVVIPRWPAADHSSGGRSETHGCLGRSQRETLGVHFVQRRLPLLRGSLRPRTARRDRLGRRQGDPLEWRRGVAIREGRKAGRIPIGGALSVEFGRANRCFFFRDDLPGRGQSARGHRTSPACGDAADMVLLSQEAPR